MENYNPSTENLYKVKSKLVTQKSPNKQTGHNKWPRQTQLKIEMNWIDDGNLLQNHMCYYNLLFI